jgi:hypothetical protein
MSQFGGGASARKSAGGTRRLSRTPHFRCPKCKAKHWYLPESGRCAGCKVVSSLTAWIATNDEARRILAEAKL